MDHWISAMTLKLRKRHAQDCTMSIQQLLDAETRQFLHGNKSDKSPTSSSEANEEYSYRLDSSAGEITCSRDNAFVFISVNMVATERHLVVNVELGLFIMESTEISESFQ